MRCPNLEAQLAAGLGALKHKAQHLEMDRKTFELDADTRRESINRLKTQQYETRRKSFSEKAIPDLPGAQDKE